MLEKSARVVGGFIPISLVKTCLHVKHGDIHGKPIPINFLSGVGCKIKALRAKTNTYIKTPARGEDPVFSISGRPDHVQSAKWEIIAAADHFSQIRASRPSSTTSNSSQGSSDKDKVTIYVRVPYRVVGLVVGPRGATIKKIQQLTRTFIVTPSRDKEPCFEVRGSPENVERARAEIERYIVLRTGNKCGMDEDTDLYGSTQSIDQLTQQMQQCQVVDSGTFQFPVMDVIPRSVFPDEGLDTPYAKPSILDGSGRVVWNSNTLPTVFTGMQFTPPDLTYQPMSAPLLSADGAFDFSAPIGVKSQPLSPTGSYESNSSDGLAAVSPDQSPLVLKRERAGAGAKSSCCCMCRSTEDVAALMPCGHDMFCQTCAHYIACSSGSCPLCNAQVTNVMHII